MTFPDSLAKLYVEKAGQQYVPSNGTEGEIFQAEFCARCERDKEANGTCLMEDRDAGDDDWCQILVASYAGEAKEWVYGHDGHPTCTAFVPYGEQVPTRCDHTADMFDSGVTP